ncbi:hypothetical protein MHC_01075 [Mycoplasma haemocanis str. Illinois]|uniref:Uncharacterized protein n=1 Tax=Mycoplasma haemocanis (strain Illinois) TaxID=1111676 RepID=H6N609_MYCHN|nr:hypothetical protein [Mycoplasma haemocanis]AEW45081.1 hypothetical protein MHC_01075 [Mycoplasma haemocanis str. Illinois]
MSISLPTKIATVVLSGGTVTAGAVYLGKGLIGNKTSVKTPIKELIKTVSPHKRLIEGSAITDPLWKEAWKEYRNAHLNKDSDSWNINGWEKPTGVISNSTDASSHFISACSSKLDEEVESSADPLYSQVVSYCTRDALVSDLIKERNPNKSPLSNADGDKWKTPWEAYKVFNSSKNEDKWKLSDWTQKKGDSNVPETFKQKCKEKLETKTVEAKDEDYEDTLNWCTK